MKSTIFWIAIVAIAWINVKMFEEKTGVLLMDKQSADGWARKCTYYMPVKLVHVVRPIQIGCKFYDRV